MILDGYLKGKLVPVNGSFIDGIWLEYNAAHAYYDMATAAYAEGIRLRPGLGFRDHEYQVELYEMPPEEKKKRGVGEKVAKPGLSNHQLGLAIDFTNVKAYLGWLEKNAARFGWFQTVSGEPWHWEYKAKK